MPYLSDTLTAKHLNFGSILNEVAIAHHSDNDMTRVSDEDLARAITIKVVVSSFDDPGEDWCRYELYDKDDTLIRSVTQPGY